MDTLERESDRERRGTRGLLRTGAVAAIAGAVVSVAAGAGYGDRPAGDGAEAVLTYLADRPDWSWPAVHLGFAVGALLWVGAFVALERWLAGGAGWALARWAVASVAVGAAVHLVNAAVDGAGVARLADSWADAPPDQQAVLLRAGEALLGVVEGTWAATIAFFHGLPFLLAGVAVVTGRPGSGGLGWLGVVGGGGSLLTGMAMFLGVAVPQWLYVVFALVVSLWMVLAGAAMWRATVRTPGGP